LIQLYSSKLDH